MSDESAGGRRQAVSDAAAAADNGFDPDDLPTIFALRATLAALDPAGPPRAVVAVEGVVTAPSQLGEQKGATPAIGILSGSFDPLTNAHAALARAALDHGGLDALYLALSRHTVDKEGHDRPTQADRALVLRSFVCGRARHGLLFFNHGLYADQAVAARAAFPVAGALRFVVGFDKARQIFDPRYYTDRDAALGQLFAAVSLLVAPRGTDGATELAILLDRPENRPFRDRVQALPFDPAYAADSSTTVRDHARAGLPIADLVPPITTAFIAATHAYDPPRRGADRYALREGLIAALEPDRAWAERTVDLRALNGVARSAGPEGTALREWLGASPEVRGGVTLRALLESGAVGAMWIGG